MKRNIFLILLFCCCRISFSQDTIPVIKKSISNSGFNDCYTYKNGIAALTKTGIIYQINLPAYSFSKLSSYGFTTIATDRNGMLWAADSNIHFYSLRDTGWKWEGFVTAGVIREIAFDSRNNPYLITDLGIYNRKTEMFYGVNKVRNHYSYAFGRGRYRTDCFYVDERDNIWIGSNARIGKEIHVFSTKTNAFVTGRMKGFEWRRNVRCLFGYGKTVFIAAYNYMGLSSIYSYRNDTIRRVHHPEYDTMSSGPSKNEEDHIGAAFFNKENKEIYYYSSQGLIRAKYNIKRNRLDLPEIVMPAQLRWNGYELESADFVAGLKKMFQYKNLIIYLHREEGIYIYDGRIITNLQ